MNEKIWLWQLIQEILKHLSDNCTIICGLLKNVDNSERQTLILFE